MAMLLKGAEVAKALTEGLHAKTEELKKNGVEPCLAILRVGAREDDLAYERGALKRCEKVGVAVRQVVLPEDVTQEVLMENIHALNADEKVHGVLMFRPLPGHLDDEAARAALDPKKDMDGITDGSMTAVYAGTKGGYPPCTAAACVALLKHYNIPIKGKRVVVIDHHRMAVGHIDNPTLIYHEPYASSASELVCELLQFMPKENNITPLEAQALLAGIMLDTRSFALHVGVRTFEAAAWLRSRGAQTADTKLLFNTSKEEYEARAHIVEGAYIYKGCAIALSDELEAGMNVVLPMAANDLLTINGVDASFVAVAKNDGVNISARSMGALNVQVILEPLGGGGHLMMAGAQLQNCTLQDAEHRIREQIDLYRAAQKENTAR